MYEVVYILVAGLLLEYPVIHEAASREVRNKDMLERRIRVSTEVEWGRGVEDNYH
jgi:hypothetical protein